MLSLDDLKKISNLAKLSIPENEQDKFLKKMNQVFGWIDQLSKIDVSTIDLNNTDDLITTSEEQDVPSMKNTRDELMTNTKFQKFDMFCVPKVVE